MEISLDNMQVSFMTAGIKTASDSVSLTAAETEIKLSLIHIQMCIRDRAENRIGTEEVVPCAENGNQSSALTFYGSSFITDATGEVVEPVSYTHLDVYKRQVHGYQKTGKSADL